MVQVQNIVKFISCKTAPPGDLFSIYIKIQLLSEHLNSGFSKL